MNTAVDTLVCKCLCDKNIFFRLWHRQWSCPLSLLPAHSGDHPEFRLVSSFPVFCVFLTPACERPALADLLFSSLMYRVCLAGHLEGISGWKRVLPQPHLSLSPSQQGLFVFINSYKLTTHTLVPIFLFMELEIHLIGYSFVSLAIMGQALNKPGLYIPLAWLSLGLGSCRIRFIYSSFLAR